MTNPCRKCGEIKPELTGNLKQFCIKCRNLKKIEQKNHQKEYRRQYFMNPQKRLKRKATTKRYCDAHREKMNAYNRKYYAKIKKRKTITDGGEEYGQYSKL